MSQKKKEKASLSRADSFDEDDGSCRDRDVGSSQEMKRLVPGHASSQRSQSENNITNYSFTHTERQYSFETKTCQKFVPGEANFKNVKFNSDKLRCKCGRLRREHEVERLTIHAPLGNGLDQFEQNHISRNQSLDSRNHVSFEAPVFPDQVEVEPNESVDRLDAAVESEVDQIAKRLKNKSTDDLKWDTTKFNTMKITKEECWGSLEFTEKSNFCSTVAKFVKLGNHTITESSCTLKRFLKEQWSLDEQETTIVFSIVGTEQSAVTATHLSDKFSEGLMKAAGTTNAYLITSGLDGGISQIVGDAVHKIQSIYIKDINGKDVDGGKECNLRMEPKLHCIGLTPWGCVQGKNCFKQIANTEKRICKYQCSVAEDKYRMPLNGNHTHFILVDNGTVNMPDHHDYKVFREKFEDYLVQQEKKSVVLIVFGGNDGILKNFLHALKNKLPVILCRGSGGYADRLVDFVLKVNGDSNSIDVSLDTLLAGYKGNSKDRSGLKSNFQVYQNQTINVITVWDDKAEKKGSVGNVIVENNFYHAILTALMKKLARDEASNDMSPIKELRLAFEWDSFDFANEEIFHRDKIWPKQSWPELNKLLLDALLKDKTDFVPGMLQLKTERPATMDLTQFLSIDQLYKMYEKTCGLSECTKPDEQAKALKKFFNKKGLSYLCKVDKDDGEKKLKWPYKQLMVWAAFSAKWNVVQFCLERREYPLASTLALATICDMIKGKCNQVEIQQEYRIKADEFEQMAIDIIKRIYSTQHGARLTQEKRGTKCLEMTDFLHNSSPMWNEMRPLDIASAGKAKEFMACTECYNHVMKCWRMIPLPEMQEQMKGITPCTGTRPRVKFHLHMVMYAFMTMVFMCFTIASTHNKVAASCMFGWILSYILGEVDLVRRLWKSKTIYRSWMVRRIVFIIVILSTNSVGFALLWIGFKDLAAVLYGFHTTFLVIGFAGFLAKYEKFAPQISVLKKLIRELIFFVILLAILLVSFGMVTQSLMCLDGKRKENMTYGEKWINTLSVLWNLYLSVYAQVDFTVEDQFQCAAGFGYQITFYPILGIYVLIANVLMLNFLIAMFNVTFESVKGKDKQICKYSQYLLLVEYERRNVFPFPLGIIERCLACIKKCRKDNNEVREVDEANRNVEVQYLNYIEGGAASKVFSKKYQKEKSCRRFTREASLLSNQDDVH